MKSIKVSILTTIIASQLHFTTGVTAQAGANNNQALDARQQHIVTISSFTAKGDLENLKKVLNDGLTAGLTINEIKEVLAEFGLRLGMRDDGGEDSAVPASRPNTPLQPTSSARRLPLKDC